MARETKVGLIVGLAFIICFAIILANRGQPIPPPSATAPFRIDSGAQVQQSAPPASHFTIQPRSSTPDAVGQLALPPSPNAAYGSQVAVRQDALLPWESAQALPTNGSEVVLSNDSLRHGVFPSTGWNTTGGGEQVFLRGTPTAGTSTSGPTTLSIPEASDRGLTFPPSMSGDAGRIAASSLDPLRPGISGVGPNGMVERTTPGSGPTGSSVSATCTVAAGDTLFKIASRNYGSRSSSVVNAIYEANRSVLKQRDTLPIGALLTLPAIGGQSPSQSRLSRLDTKSRPSHAAAPPAAADKSARLAKGTETKERPSAGSGRDFAWYQVRKKDRYASIAREQLGDANRWPEIHELNRDKFPNPGQIREGVRIKLPVTVKTGGKSRA